MPAYGTAECGIVLEICEWAYASPEAHAVDPSAVEALRKYVEAPAWSWRELYDRALKVWAKGYEKQQIEAAKELF